MDLFEYQAKELFQLHDVPVGLGKVVTTPEDAERVAREIGGVTVVKAQVKTGGRGKAGGVKVAKTPEEAGELAGQILGMDIKGHTVHRVLIDPGAQIEEEYYVSFLLDRANRSYLAMASYEGGMEIEQLADERPEALAQVPVDALAGVDAAKAREIVELAHFPAEVAIQVTDVVVKLWSAFVGSDATLVEVNPLAKLADGSVKALDGKVTLDDNADFRHAINADYVDTDSTDPLERRAIEKNLNYVKLDGEVGIIGNGAGLVMSTLDVVAYAGERYSLGGGRSVKPANFLDIGGGASAEVMANGLDIILSDPSVRSVFVNVFGGITACDAVANGIVTALGMLGSSATKPLVVRLDGNNVIEGRRILNDAAHPLVTLVDTMDDAADKAAELAGAVQLDGDLFGRDVADHRAGHDRLGRHETHSADARVRELSSWWGKRAQGRYEGRLRRDGAAGLRHGGGGHERNRRRRHCHVRAAAICKGRGAGGDRRCDPARRGDHRGYPGAGFRLLLGVCARQVDPDRRAELPRPDQPRQVQRRHHSR